MFWPIIDGVTTFKWDKTNIGSGIEIGNNGYSCFLKEGPYMFRTVIGDQVESRLKIVILSRP